MSMFDVFGIASSAMHAQSKRLNTTASNLANAESVAGPDGKPYHAKQVVFQAQQVGSSPYATGVQVTQVVESAAPMRIVYDPKNPAADEKGYVTMPNVDVVEEMTNMISASRAYQTNVEMMNTAKALLQKTLTIGQG
ncbi:flagellar basal body rod protein FlgC [Uliginosibacterium sp. H3]|uniref:Flagellar basal-body rod protein FlgC n=1 Tax=Uliginosibacterium silvisoli TaxID=3114758 RepID=A0ABU6K650_9RHOO|nr:flagellar basal body rod protein FlgC [Uliginosibacterium sp. H3]